ncbi:TonB-dependent receptor [Polymorphobacter fuscus]|uniref:TonB-dependent receptor n=1 Tax=Sandarakinorhabdus fusca TaxID=1439888 RepID=A0A7C9KKI3_9SPHN|nr:TonB-dependent receptor [Polymorphobacter fuscus]KAB7648915.1 TonB-dependent receptor [Polymorphobacter fuscus]MQT16503.1 TonB-dependent receptor [Polymorphobacter fuscus]NJC07207.1 iron complex outermembrane receptor protein [Polymorphobacter fuscus]
MMRTLFLGTVALAALSVAPAQAQVAASSRPGPAPGPVAAADTDDSLEIIVTAQKRSERLQDVPVAVSVVSGDMLARQGALSLEGAQYLVPSLNFRKSGTSINQSLFLRGVGTSTFSIAGEPSVSTVLDGVVLSRAGEAFSDLVDIERIEVLRGPQGTLFGKNSSAGVVNIVSKRPGDVLGGFAEGGLYLGNGTEYRARGAIDVPLSDNARSRITGFYGKYDGNIFNDAAGINRRVNGYERYGVRGMVEADIGESAKLTVIADWRQANDDCCAEVIGTAPTGVGALALAGINFQGDETRTIRQNLVTRTEETSWGLSAQLDAELGTQTVTSITAYRNYANREIRDGDWIGQPIAGIPQLHDDGPQTGSTFSQELRLTSPADQFVSYVLGAFYSHAVSERTFTRNVVSCNPAPAVAAVVPCGAAGAPPTSLFSGTANFGSTFDNVAVFGQSTINFSDRLRGIVGLRYTIDNLSVFHRRVTTPNVAGIPGVNRNFDQGVFNTSTPANINGDPLASNGAPFTTATNADNLSGKAGLQFDVNSDVMAYGTYSRGYKGPAYNIFFNLNANGTNVIAPETADSYEIGLKNVLFDGSLILNLAGYYAKYKNFQANNPDLVAGVVITRFTNAGDISTRGGELDLVWRPVTDFTITGGLAYTDARVDRFNAPPGAAVVPVGTPLAFAPKWKGSLGADYRWRTGAAVDLAFGVQASTQSSQLSLFDASALVRQQGLIDAYSLVDLQFAVVEKDDRFRLQFVVKNLFDQSFPAQITNGGPGGSLRYLIPREADRYFGVTGRYNF